MLVQVKNVLTADEVAHCRRVLEAGDWVDGNVTSGLQSAKAKHNPSEKAKPEKTN